MYDVARFRYFQVGVYIYNSFMRPVGAEYTCRGVVKSHDALELMPKTISLKLRIHLALVSNMCMH